MGSNPGIDFYFLTRAPQFHIMINVFLLLKEELPTLRIKERFEVLPGAKVGFNTEKETM